MGGDGIALWYTKDRMEKGNVFGAKNTFVGKRPELVIEANNRVRVGRGSVAKAVVASEQCEPEAKELPWKRMHAYDSTMVQLKFCDCHYNDS